MRFTKLFIVVSSNSIRMLDELRRESPSATFYTDPLGRSFLVLPDHRVVPSIVSLKEENQKSRTSL
ncbi:speckle-type POZ protein B-like isoform X1 [Vespula maculifrons]|uniref:Speckle-type POZ protein B-like isoform X1 n=1 Tax=Vespula maculifrons TaxID=7453 RepID=A0ABD2AL41_VESMC